MGVGAAQDFALRVSDKIIVGAEQSTYLTAYDNTQAGNVYMYNAPYLNVALTDMATLKSRYEYEILSNTKDELNKDSSRLLSGVDLQLNEKWSIYPHLSLGLDGQINTKALGVNFWLSGAIF